MKKMRMEFSGGIGGGCEMVMMMMIVSWNI